MTSLVFTMIMKIVIVLVVMVLCMAGIMFFVGWLFELSCKRQKRQLFLWPKLPRF
jgi:hypothetical protein